MDQLELIANKLLETETLEAVEFDYLMREGRLPIEEERKEWESRHLKAAHDAFSEEKNIETVTSESEDSVATSSAGPVSEG